VEVNSIVFTANANSFTSSVSPSDYNIGGRLIFSDAGIIDNGSVLQTFVAYDAGQIIFNNTSTAGDARIYSGHGGEIIFNDSSTAEGAVLVAGGGCYDYSSGAIIFNDTSTGGTARVQVFFGCSENSGSGHLDIRNQQSGVTVGSIEGDGNINVAAHRLRVGANNLNTTFYGNINVWNGGSLTKVGTGILTLAPYNGLPDNLNLMLVSGSPIKLIYGPDVIASLKIDGVSQPPGIYGGPMSGAPHIVPEFRGTGSVHVFPSTLANISTRAHVQTGDNVMIGGFIIEHPYSTVEIRAIGPELSRYHVPNALANPKLELHDATGALIASNDDWQHTIIGGVILADQVDYIRDSGRAPTDPRESAMIVTLPQPGNYTAIVRGVNNTTGVGLVEVYDHSTDPRIRDKVLGNVSTRSFVQTGNDVMIGGFIVQGSGAKRVVVRAIGPELTQHGVPNPLADPTLELHDATGALIASNDNWMTTVLGGIITRDQVQDIRDSHHAPRDPSESAIMATLPPGNYTALVRGVNNTTGVGLVEVYDLD
jgi:hypothetical protein